MAPNKKKKKAASNPGRGFATTSIPSKSKPPEQKHEVAVTADLAASAPTATDNNDFEKPQKPDRELHELEPDELERQLEESDLQLLAEKYGDKTRKDASHQASKLSTEKRLLRSQAETLIVRSWLPEDLLNLVLSYVETQVLGAKAVTQSSEDTGTVKCPPADDMVIRIWTVEQTLIHLGFSADQARDAIRNLVKRELSGTPVVAAGKEAIWGLDECLNWLALTSDASQLPQYVRHNVNHAVRHQASVEAQIPEIPDTPNSTPPMSSPISPREPEEKTTDSPKIDMREGGGRQYSEVESDTDDDPTALTAKYLALKKRLYDLRHDLEPTYGKPTLKSSKRKSLKADHSDADPQIVKLQRKLTTVEADILFDHEEAHSQWTQIYNAVTKEASERRRLELNNDKLRAPKVPETDRGTTPIADPGDINAEANDTDEYLLADLFSVTDVGGAASLKTPAAEEKPVTFRDFGRFTGLKPRRVLEEACKARDPGSQALFRVVSSNPSHIRYSVTVKWSRDQPEPASLPITTITCEANHRRVQVEMTSIATPDAAQSEAYVSTVALFLLFSPFPKEEKVYYRLPGIWRDLWAEFTTTKKDESDAADRKAIHELRRIISDCNGQLQKGAENRNQDGGILAMPDDIMATSHGMSPREPIKDGPMLRSLWTSKALTPSFQRMLAFRQGLPIWKFKDDLLEAIESNQAIIICGETGCGKSTQVPSFILEHELLNGRSCKVYCTEPRRISAISLARRVCEELGERKGDVGTAKSLIGYAIRLESKITPQTRLVYATTGIVMRMLEASNDLGDITHLVLDEVHERTIDSDFLLIILRKLMTRRPTLRIILMSATVNAQRFSDYLAGAPILNVPGRTYPVETRYLEDAIELIKYHDQTSTGAKDEIDIEDREDAKQDIISNLNQFNNLEGYSMKTRNALVSFNEYLVAYDLIVMLLKHIATSNTYEPYSKAVLIFLPGIVEIRRLQAMILGDPTFGKEWSVYAMHSTIATEEQEQAFLVPSEGTRKIVLATNIAETGITIPDVTCVIDTGKHKEMRFDERRQLSRLIESFISRANAKQRRGRAGRVAKGLCFHLFSKARHDTLMAEEQTPEMLRLSLQDLVLRVKICNLGDIEPTLAEALDPPSSRNVRRAIDSLIDVKALTTLEDLTPLGRQLAKLPLDVFLGKLILLGSIFKCLDGALTIAAILTSKSPFSAPFGSRSQAELARLAFKRSESDLLTVYNAYCAWRHVCVSKGMPEQQFCRKNYLSQQTLSNIEDLKAQLTGSLAEAGFIDLAGAERAALHRVQSSRGHHFVKIPAQYDSNGDNDLVLHSILGWSFYPKLLRSEGKGWRNVANNQSVSLAPTSVNKLTGTHPRWLSFYHIMQSGNKFYNAHETSSIEDFAIALICGEAEFKMYCGVIVVDGHRIRFCVDDWKSMLALKYLRMNIRQIMTQAFRSPGRELTAQQQTWFDVWQKIFSQKSRGKS